VNYFLVILLNLILIIIIKLIGLLLLRLNRNIWIIVLLWGIKRHKILLVWNRIINSWNNWIHHASLIHIILRIILLILLLNLILHLIFLKVILSILNIIIIN